MPGPIREKIHGDFAPFVSKCLKYVNSLVISVLSAIREGTKTLYLDTCTGGQRASVGPVDAPSIDFVLETK